MATEETWHRIHVAETTFKLAVEIEREAARIFRETVLDSDITVLEKGKLLGLTTARVYQLRPVKRKD